MERQDIEQSDATNTCRKQRAVLTQKEAVEIFRLRAARELPLCLSSANEVAEFYGVHERTVRDIWLRRTWKKATSIIDDSDLSFPLRKAGRPKGSKDVKPRISNQVHRIGSTHEEHDSVADTKESFKACTFDRHESEFNSDPARPQLLLARQWSGTIQVYSASEFINNLLYRWAKVDGEWVLGAAEFVT
jgi:hypothetical protein